MNHKMKSRLLVTALVSAVVLGVTPTASAADTSAPVLVDWTVQTIAVDISNRPGNVTVKFILSDDSKINEPKLLVKSLKTTQSSSFAVVKEISRSGKLILYEATATINQGQSPREWEWVLYPLSDVLGNTDNLFGPAANWSRKFDVLDTEYSLYTYTATRRCLIYLEVFNQKLEKYLFAKVKDPNNVRLALLQLKYNLPSTLLDKKLCETDLEKTVQFYTTAQAAALETDLGPIFEEIDIKREKVEAAAELKAKQEATAKAATKRTTIICAKGKLIKKVTALKPKCPAGYKVKK